MKFLDKDLRGLSEKQREIALKQLESCIKEIYSYFRDAMFNDLSHDLALHRSAAKIYGILDWLKKMKADLDRLRD